jgi:C-terminal processing protease CtpA/Prc
LYWCEYLPDTQTLYLQFNSHHEEPGHPFKDFARELFAVADSHPVRRLVLDLRFNKGGHPKIADPLEDGLRSRPALTANGHLYALIGWTTFSAAMDEAAYFRKHFHAILVGEPAGNKPNHYGSAESFNLPNSKLAVEYSTKYAHLIRDADPLSLEPDITVPSTLNDFLAGRDPVLGAALHHPLP